MQSVSPNSLFSMLTDQNQASSIDSIWGIKPQMGRFLSSDKANPDSPSTFANIFLQLQAGVSDDQAKALEAYGLASDANGNALPVAGQKLPVLNDLMTTNLADQLVEPVAFELSVQTGEDEGDLDGFINVEQIDEAQNIASHLNIERCTSVENRTNIETHLNGVAGATSPNDAAAIAALQTPQTGDEKLVDPQIRLDVKTLEKQDKINLNEIVEEEADPAFAVVYAHPLSNLDEKTVKNKSVNSSLLADSKIHSDGINRSSLPLNLQPQAGTQLQEPVLVDENTVDDQALSGIKGASLPVNDLKSDSMGALSNLNQLQQPQSMQSLNVQAGQIQSSATLQLDANATAELERSIEQAEGEAELSVNEQINKLSNKQDSLYLGKQSQLWGKQLGNHITTLIKQDVQEAKIHLDPPELGSLEIKLQVQHQEAKVQIQVSQPQVRDVLEQQSARLREALAQEGMSLSGFDVSSGNQQQTGQQAQEQGALFGDGELSQLEGESESSNSKVKVTSVSVSLVDTFA